MRRRILSDRQLDEVLLAATYVYFIDAEVRPAMPGFEFKCRDGDSLSYIASHVQIEPGDSDEVVCEKWHDAYVAIAELARTKGRTLGRFTIESPVICIPRDPQAASGAS